MTLAMIWPKDDDAGAKKY